MTRYDLAELPLVKPLLKNRWPQFALRLIALAGFVFAITAGLIGTPVGSRNFGIVFVWIGWWALLMLIAVPLFGRGWCSICPIPMPGEWLQNGAILGPRGRGLSLGRRWPKRLRGIWLQNGLFALVALFSSVVLTQPGITSIILLAFLVAAVILSVVFERRAFCRYVCPVGGFIGLYSQLAPIEVRAKDASRCASHTEKTCYTGSADGYGCPWQVFPGGLTKNTYCGMCVECLRTCPHDNIALNLRPFGTDLLNPTARKLDEAFKAFIMLGSAMVYSAVMLGPWGTLKSAAYAVGSAEWFAYALGFVVFVFGIIPGLFYLAVRVGRAIVGSTVSVRKTFVTFAYAIVPLGLAAWIAFSLSFVFANLSYVWHALSDPLGAGWNLLGTANVGWAPYFSGGVPSMQVMVLIGGLIWASLTAQRLSAELKGSHRQPLSARTVALQAAPVMAFCLLVTIGLLGLLI